MTLTDNPIAKERTGPDQDERSVSTEYAPGSWFLVDKSFSWLSYPVGSGHRGIAIGSHDQGLLPLAGFQDRGTEPSFSGRVDPSGTDTGIRPPEMLAISKQRQGSPRTLAVCRKVPGDLVSSLQESRQAETRRGCFKASPVLSYGVASGTPMKE